LDFKANLVGRVLSTLWKGTWRRVLFAAHANWYILRINLLQDCKLVKKTLFASIAGGSGVCQFYALMLMVTHACGQVQEQKLSITGSFQNLTYLFLQD